MELYQRWQCPGKQDYQQVILGNELVVYEAVAKTYY